MGAKFIVDRRCSVKTSLTLTGLIEALKHQGLFRRVADMLAAGSLQVGSVDDNLEGLMLPDVGIPVNVSFRELQHKAMALEEHRVTCRHCPSALHGLTGGCITYVPYPLSEGMEYLLWITAVRALTGELPAGLLPPARLFAERARRLSHTPFSEGMRQRGDILAPKPRVHATGFLRRKRLSSAQVLDAFFVNGVLAGEELRVHTGYLAAALAVGKALEPALKDRERRQALIEDTEPYWQVWDLMQRAVDQDQGVYVWP